MFNLENAIKQWRKRMSRAGVTSRALAELEEHLREAVKQHARAGANANKAFEMATRDLGEPKALGREFSKTDDSEGADWRKATLITISSMLLLVAALIGRRHVALTPALAVHIFALTGGYGCVLLAGCLGLFLMVRNFFRTAANISPSAIRRSVELCYKIALPLVLLALLSGTIWAKSTLGGVWGGSREAGALLVLAWMVSALLAMQFWKLSQNSIGWISLSGAFVTCTGWFAVGARTPMLFSFVGFGCLLAGIWAAIQFKLSARPAFVMPRFDEFTDLARRATDLAQEEAANLRHDYVGTEHLLLGIIACESGLVMDVFHKLRTDGDAIRTEVERTVAVGRQTKSARDLPYTPRARKALVLAAREAAELGHSLITPEHILLGLLAENEGVAGLVLRKMGINAKQARQYLMDRMGSDGEDGALPVLA